MTPSEPTAAARVLFTVLALVAAGALAFGLITQRWLVVDKQQLQVELGSNYLSWGPRHDLRVGLRSMTICFRDRTCTEIQNTDTPVAWQRALVMHDRAPSTESLYDLVAAELGMISNLDTDRAQTLARELLASSTGFAVWGWITFVGCALGLVSLVLTALIATTGKRIAWPVMPTTTAVLGLAVALICGCVFVVTRPGPGAYTTVEAGFWALGVGVVGGVVAAIKLSRMILRADNFAGATMHGMPAAILE
jgi:hypothetical protein